MNQNGTNTAIIILGMPRSGTLAITRAVNLLGAEISSDMKSDSEENRLSESKRINTLHDALLHELGSSWDSPYEFDHNWKDSNSLGKYRRALVDILQQDFPDPHYFVITDPRMCRLLPVWFQVIETMNVIPVFILPFRNPLEVATSLKESNGFAVEKSCLLWLRCCLDSELYTRGHRRTFYSYDSLRKDWLTVLDDISTKLNVQLPASVKDLRGKLDLFPASETKDQHMDFDSVLNEAHSDNPLKKAYRSFSYLSEDPNNTKVLGCLDELRTKLNNLDLEDTVLQGIRKVSLDGNQWSEEKVLIDNGPVSNRINIKETATSYEQSRKLSRLTALLERKDLEVINLKKKIDWQTEALRDFRQQLEDKAAQIGRLRKSKHAGDPEWSVLEEKYRSALLEAKSGKILLSQTKERLGGIEKSWSYRIGRFVTWPFRLLYEATFAPFIHNPGNFKLAANLIGTALRHPAKSLSLLNAKRIRNAWITFFKNPSSAFEVVSHYQRVITGNNTIQLPNFATGGDSNISVHSVPGRVSIICINRNGCHHLKDLMASLLNQDYRDIEIIMVDNGSSDDSVLFLRKYYPEVLLVALDENIGFAEANNVGIEVASGEFLCIINNDGKAHSKCVSSMVDCIQQSDDIAAVGAKILFWEKFVQLNFQVVGEEPALVYLDKVSLEGNLSVYNKFFFGEGWQQQATSPEGLNHYFNDRAGLKVPVCEGQDKIHLRLTTTADHPVKVKITTSVRDLHTEIDLNQNRWRDITLDFGNHHGDSGITDLINNAGTWVKGNGDVGDRGFAEIDSGQYDKTEPIDALCGCAMLVRRSTLQDRPLFCQQLFAYYEDTELSLWLRRRGFKLLYCPDAIFYHKHASTSRENSPFFRYYVTRNRLLFLALHFDSELWLEQLHKAKSNLNHLKNYYLTELNAAEDEAEFARMIPQLISDWDEYFPLITENNFYHREDHFPRIAVYNNFWHTLGGGENHASVIAHTLQRFGPVDLISENDFSISDLELQFDIDLKFCRKIMVSTDQIHHLKTTSGKYDLFVNSTFGSDLRSHARNSIYVVSFPFPLPETKDSNFLDTYNYWANSMYTAGWIRKWWKKEADVIYPSLALPANPVHIKEKTRLILHVGRFFRNGHNKKQLEIAKIFRQLIETKPLTNWELLFIGQVDPKELDYVDEVRKACDGYPVTIKNNVPLNTLRSYYRKAAIYIHATGLSEDVTLRPEMSEHFGISTIEAMSYGCVPVVIKQGGQVEIVENKVNGFLFRDEVEMAKALENCIDLFENDEEQYKRLVNNARARSENFTRQNTAEQMLNALLPVGFSANNELI